ncbi:MAG: hypothetical protein C4518_02535 [Desulfobacteraceae bacterium]|nr:MAG: hypothetical protein C4518_02535 [Desulfobacteraceae bacterium]
MKLHIKAVATIGIIILCLVFAASAVASEVAQGKCIEYNTETKVIKLQEYDTNFAQNKYGNPTSIESDFDVSTAKIGHIPEPGDILRISYKIEGAGKIALKIMNVSKQDLMKK